MCFLNLVLFFFLTSSLSEDNNKYSEINNLGIILYIEFNIHFLLIN